jgi:hypothetical protein
MMTNRLDGGRGTPGTGADDGHPGEGDNISADVEKVLYPLW